MLRVSLALTLARPKCVLWGNTSIPVGEVAIGASSGFRL